MKTKQSGLVNNKAAKSLIFLAVLAFCTSVFAAGSGTVPTVPVPPVPAAAAVDNNSSGNQSDTNNPPGAGGEQNPSLGFSEHTDVGVPSDQGVVSDQPCSNWKDPTTCSKHGCLWASITSDANLAANPCH